MLFAPGLRTRADIAAVVACVDLPVNVILGFQGVQLTLAEPARLGVTRVSPGASLARAAYGAFLRGAREVLEQGTLAYADDALQAAELNRIFAAEAMAVLSDGCEASYCNVEEPAGHAASALWRDGAQAWRVEYAGGEAPRCSRPTATCPRVSTYCWGRPDVMPTAFPTPPRSRWSSPGRGRASAMTKQPPAFDATPFRTLKDLRARTPWWKRLRR